MTKIGQELTELGRDVPQPGCENESQLEIAVFAYTKTDFGIKLSNESKGLINIKV